MKLIELELNQIKLLPNRYRQDMGNLETLMESIKAVGLFNPITVTEDYTLIAGERRYQAHVKLGLTSIHATIQSIDETAAKIIEILENMERKSFTWQEEVLAMEDLHMMMKASKGEKWSERATAKESGFSSGEFATDLNLAEALKEVPDVFEGCKNKSQALKALKKFQIDEAHAELTLRKAKSNYGSKAKSIVFYGDCNVLIDSIPDRKLNAIISDPIYGMDVFNKRYVNREMPDSSYDDQYDDSVENFMKTLEIFIKKASLKLKEDSVVLMFCAFQNAQWLIDKWNAEGFSMDIIPGIWVRGANTARTNQPTRYFNRCYDMFVYGTRGKYTLNKQGTTNVLEYVNVHQSDRIHPSQKPLELMEEIISRLCLPGSIILDPMCGSGQTLSAALKRGCQPVGFEIDEKYYNIALKTVIDTLNAKDAGHIAKI
mgnify:CR=1 FL=1